MRVNGTEGVKLIECINPDKNKWRIRWDIKPNTSETDQAVSGVNYEEIEYSHKPTIEEIKKAVIDWYNSQIDDSILKDFVWNNTPVWLSMENQFNYKVAFDLAVQTNGDSLPITFKFGTDSEPVYHEFTTLADIQDFYIKAVAFKDKVLSDGWKAKDAFDFTPYEL